MAYKLSNVSHAGRVAKRGNSDNQVFADSKSASLAYRWQPVGNRRYSRLGSLRYEGGNLIRLVFFDADAAVFHLAAVAFKFDRAAGGDFHCGLEDFAIAQGVRSVAFDDDFEFVPIALTIVLQL